MCTLSACAPKSATGQLVKSTGCLGADRICIVGSVDVMEWMADVSVGEWLRDRIDGDGLGWAATMHGVVPRGFPAYARIFHPATRSKPVDRAWPPLPYEKHEREWVEFSRAGVEVDTEAVRWADAAAAFGTRMHPLAQWGRIVHSTATEWNPNDWQQVHAPNGWQYDAPSEGEVDAPTLAAIAEHLARATATPGDGFIAVWEGYGGLLGSFGQGNGRAFLSFSSDDPAVTAGADARYVSLDEAADMAAAARHEEMLRRSIPDPFNNVFRKPQWWPGILSDEISKGPRLELPNRGYVLFRGGIAELADPDWQLHMPWRDREAEERGFAPSAHSPNLAWPADRAWVLVAEIDYDSTIVGGTPELIDALCADPRLETLPIPAEADLAFDGDTINR